MYYVLSGLILSPCLWHHSVIILRAFSISENTVSSYFSLTVIIKSSAYACIWTPAFIAFQNKSSTTIDQNKSSNTPLYTSLLWSLVAFIIVSTVPSVAVIFRLCNIVLIYAIIGFSNCFFPLFKVPFLVIVVSITSYEML